jgi:hypothetical protein
MRHKLIFLTVLLTALSALSTEYFVDASRPNDTGSATNWATAKHTIQAAVDLTVDSDTVWVTNGTYVLSAEISVTNAITIRSVNGPDVTIFNGNGVFGCFSLNDSACTISGFTIANGFQGVRCADTTPVVVNCIIATNRADFSSGGGMFRGTAQNCIFRGNEAADGGGMAEGKSYNCTFIGNVANPFGGAIGANGYGGGQYGGETYNCLFIDNTAGMLGCTIASGTAYNCTFISTSCVDVYRSVVYNSVFSPEKGANAGSEFFSSCASDLINGVNGNITNAPLFVDAANGNFRLQSNSPCINWGNNSVVSNTTDLAGNPRIVEGVVDMGAYEYQEVIGLADSDNDGINDDWERSHGGNQNPERTCSNGVNTILQAYIAGLDPHDPADKFSFLVDRSTPFGNVLRWQNVAGREYAVYYSTNLLNGFIPLIEHLVTGSGTYIDEVYEYDGPRYYKIDVQIDDNPDDNVTPPSPFI